MSTPSTATAVHHPHHFYPRYSDYKPPTPLHRPKPPQQNDLQAMAYNSYDYNGVAATNGNHASKLHSNLPPLTEKEPRSSMDEPSSRRQRSANWNDFYKNGLPSEVIVIEDDSPGPQPPRTIRLSPAHASRTLVDNSGSVRHVDKRRRVNTPPKQNSLNRAATKIETHSSHHQVSASSGTVSSGRRTSGPYSTGPTSLESSSSANRQQVPVREAAQPGQKRKRPERTAEVDAEQLEFIAQHRTWSNYFPPPNPPIKAHEVFVAQVKEVSLNILH